MLSDGEWREEDREREKELGRRSILEILIALRCWDERERERESGVYTFKMNLPVIEPQSVPLYILPKSSVPLPIVSTDQRETSYHL